ncbi:hypothetical protein [Thermosphaera sp.]
MTSVFNDSPVVSCWAAVGPGAEKVTLSSTQGETITVTAAEAGEYQIEATRLDTGQPTETKVTVTLRFVEVALIPVPVGNTPDLEPGLICINAQPHYRQAKFRATVDPTGRPPQSLLQHKASS